MTYEEAKKLAIKESETNNHNYVYVLFYGRGLYDIACDFMELTMKQMLGGKIVEQFNSHDCYMCDCYDRDAEQCTMSSIDRYYACPIYACDYVHDMELEEEYQEKGMNE